MMKGNIKLLALLIGATLSGSALASTPDVAKIPNQNEKAQSPYIFNEKTGDLISYDNARSTLAEGNYVRQQHLGGLFSWEVSMDNGDLLNAMNEGLENRPFTPKGYESGHTYQKDDIVKSQGKYYQCKVTGWCGQVGTDSYYAPGAGLYWQQAWERV